MNGPGHFKCAQDWLFKAKHPSARGDGETAESCASIAQVHATLALILSFADVHPTSMWASAAGETGASEDPP